MSAESYPLRLQNVGVRAFESVQEYVSPVAFKGTGISKRARETRTKNQIFLRIF